jgi:glycosyltransferase involved in cell wall biosynthesis
VPGTVILFVASFAHPPNQEALLWFVAQVLPLVRERVSDARLAVVGSNPPQAVLDLAGEAISVSGNVSDDVLRQHYQIARVAAVPLRYGAGVKLKVVEALRAGVPLVTTQVGAQGLPGLSQVVAVEETAASFAAAVVALLRDDVAWKKRSRQQVEFARTRFSRQVMTESLLGAFRGREVSAAVA